jgi:hypothetical protein
VETRRLGDAGPERATENAAAGWGPGIDEDQRERVGQLVSG